MADSKNIQKIYRRDFAERAGEIWVKLGDIYSLVLLKATTNA